MRQCARALGLMVAVTVAAAGCSDDDGPGAESAATTSTGAPAPSSTAAASTSTTAAEAPAALADVRVALTRVATLEQPLALAIRPGDPDFYVAQQNGRVRAVRNGQVDPQLVLDLSGEVTRGYEQGLLGLTFSPDGAHLYVHFTNQEGDTRVLEFAFAGGRADLASRRQVLAVDQPFANHNGGQLIFGPDGFLYLGLGDGGGGGDPEGNSQDLGALLGKILRIDPRPAGGQPYGIPEGNPFVGQPGARPEIWAYGLRNPWRFSFDRETRDLWIGDVGQGAVEEIDFAPASAGAGAGQNYGWNRLEGNQPYRGEAPPAGAVAPIHTYALDGGNCSVVGGVVYRGQRIPALRGAYLYADFCVGQVFALRQGGGRVVDHRALGIDIANLSSFGEDAAGEVYAMSLADGGLYRLDPAP